MSFNEKHKSTFKQKKTQHKDLNLILGTLVGRENPKFCLISITNATTLKAVIKCNLMTWKKEN